MTLDLEELTAGWDCPPGELRARVVVGRDGQDVIQLHIDLGVMQMFPAGRPDGQRYRGLPSAREYVQRELRRGGARLEARDWQELERELLQTNYRRLALAALVEDALAANDEAAARRHVRRALADIDAGLEGLRLITDAGIGPSGHAALRPTLVFDRARLVTQLHVVDGQVDEAIEHAEDGAAELDTLLAEMGCDETTREQDPGVRFLRDLGQQLRREYGVTRTLREQLDEALAHEDFETASEIRDEMRRRAGAPPEDEPDTH